MAGLSSLVTNKDISTTTLPSWYESAQQQAITNAMNIQPGAVNQNAQTALSGVFGDTGAFKSGQSILEDIGTGIANPWLTSASGEVTPNVATPLGGYIQSQRDYAQKMLPDVTAQSTAGRIAGGDFGSSMNRAADIAATGKVMSDMEQRQLKAILDSQQTGVAAGAGLSNLANALAQSGTNVATYQENQPYASSANLAKILQSIQTGKTTTQTKDLGALNQILGLLSFGQTGLKALQGGDYVRDSQGNVVKDAQGKPVKTTGLLGQLGVTGGVGGLISGAYDYLTGDSGGSPQAGSSYYDQAGNYVFTNEAGETMLIDPGTGQIIETYEPGSYGNPEEDQGGSGNPEYDQGGGTWDDFSGGFIPGSGGTGGGGGLDSGDQEYVPGAGLYD
jgi:hypothetical protein